MRIAILALITTLALATTTAHAQATWQGLQFGETRDEAKAQLASQSFAMEVSQDGMLQSVADYDLYLPGFIHPFPFKVNLRFVNNHLTNVDLAIDAVAMRSNFPEVGAGSLSFAGSHLAQTLAAKYGHPVFRDFDCSATNQNSDCIVTWRGDNQAISLTWFNARPGIQLRYQMISPEL
ncbi:MAG: hypothetical protein V4555_16375 [Acidobacteriota bacterium]